MTSYKDSYCNSEAYQQEHRFCPKCGCVSHGTTLVCCYGDKDTNRSRCHCGWHGEVHDRISFRVENPCQCKFCIRKDETTGI